MARYSAGTKNAEEVPSLNRAVKVGANSRSGEMPRVRTPRATPPSGVLAQASDSAAAGVTKLPLPTPVAPDVVLGPAAETSSNIDEYSGSGLIEIPEASGSGLLLLNESSDSGLIQASEISVLPDDTFQRIDPPTTLPTLEGFYEALED